MASSPRIDELRKKFEENPRRYFAPLANEYRKAGDVQQAIAICREYLPQQPGHMSGHIVFGQALYEARTFEEAKSVFETALSLDPENLIALRHLGDIALIIGDSENAKIWYKRVLEADPRNEEIQAQLATIEKASASAPTPSITPAVPETPAPLPAPTPATPSSAAPTVVMKAVQPPSRTPAPTTATSPTAEINLDSITPPAAPPSAAAPTVEVPQIIPPEPVVEAPPATLEGLEGTQAEGVGDAPISGFSLDGLETTSLSTESAPPAATPMADLDFGPAGAPAAPEPAAAPPTIDLDFGAPAAPAPAAETPAMDALPDLDFAPPATPAPTPVAQSPAVETDAPALDLDLGSLGSPTAPPAPSPAPAPVAAAAPAVADDEAPLDLEISLPASAPVAAAIPEPLAPPAPPVEAPIAQDPVAEAPEPMELEAPAPVTTSAPFVTETMADLYVQQGHRDEALRVYRALLDQRPGDAGILEKIARLTGEAPAAASIPVGSSGPSIRDLLFAIAARRPGYRPEFPSSNGSHEAPPDTAAPAQAASTPAVRSEEASGGAESRQDALGAALGFSGSADHDEAAAQLLARAFVRNGRGHPSALGGAPARQAGDDLSLRTVFKDSEPSPPPSSFSFDQFFSQRASAEGRAGASPEGQAAESAEDVAHFTQWLEGLKKR